MRPPQLRCYNLVRCLTIELEVELGLVATVIPVGEGLEFASSEAMLSMSMMRRDIPCITAPSE